MRDVYKIMLADQSIGTVIVKKEGLYYRFQCRCRLSGEIMYQLIVKCDETECNLGVFVPVENEFGIDTRLPIKKVGDGKFSFYAVARHPDITGKFVPIRADEPFSYLGKIQNAHLDVQNGVLGIVILEEIN